MSKFVYIDVRIAEMPQWCISGWVTLNPMIAILSSTVLRYRIKILLIKLEEQNRHLEFQSVYFDNCFTGVDII